MSDTSHDGTGAFCGSTVDRNFMTCTGCGATWRTVVNGWGHLALLAAAPFGIIAGTVTGLAMMDLGLFVATSFGAMVAMFAWGASMRTTAWFRQ